MRPAKVIAAFILAATLEGTEVLAEAPHPKVFAPNGNPAPADFIRNVRLFAAPPFVHWDMREFPGCQVPWVLGPAPVPDIDGNGTANQAADRTAAITALTAAFTAWGDVTPSIIDFTMGAAAAPPTSGLALDGHNTLNFADAALDDCQVAPIGGPAGTGGVVVTPGSNGMLETAPMGDDVVMGGSIVDGGNGMAETTAAAPPGSDDCQAAPVGGPPVAAGVNVTAGPNAVLETQPQGDDMVAGTNIVDGGNGMSDTQANNQLPVGNGAITGLFFDNRTGVLLESDIVFSPADGWRNFAAGAVPIDDVQIVPFGAGVTAGGLVVSAGANGMLETTPTADDVVMAGNIVDGGNGMCDTKAGNQRLADLQQVAMHEIGHFIGVAHPLDPGDLDDVQVAGADDVQNIAVGAAAAAGDRTVSAGNDALLKTSPGANEFAASTSIFRSIAGNVTSRANSVLGGGNVVTAGPDGVLVTRPQGDDVANGAGNAIIDGGNLTAETTANNAGVSNPAPNAIMNPFFAARAGTNHTLATSDTDSCNFLYTPDLGDAPDPLVAQSTEYPSLVHDTGNGRTLNGVQLDARAPGAEHLFGFFGGGAVPRFQYEWLGTSIDDSDMECEALVPDLDAADDGVTFGGIFIPGGGPIAVTVNVRTARDIEGQAHCYALGNPMYLNAWFDWNADGDWDDPLEYVVGPVGGFVQVYGAGPQTFMVTAPVGAVPGGYARVRLDWGEDVGQAPIPTPTATGVAAIPTGPTPTMTCPTPGATPFGGRIDTTLDRERGAAQFGEVEDYPLSISTVRHFQCYEVHAPIDPIPDITLDDQFGFSTVTVIEPRRLCTPASKDSQDPSAAFDPQHLVGYRIDQTTPEFADVREVLGPQTIVNQFGTIVVKLIKPDYLFVPSAKSLVASPPPLVNPTVDHFKCYKIRGARIRRSVQIDDQFGSLLLDVKKPLRLCAPVDKNGEGIRDPATHLMCYKVRLLDAMPAFTPPAQIFVNNQFGPDAFGRFRPTELCVPSVKNPGS